MSRLVLIVEDSEPCAETLQIALELIPGLEVRSIGDARHAMAAIDRIDENHGEQIAAIVTDLHMSRTDGLSLISELRGQPRFTRLPILLISGDSDPALPGRALAQGADAFFAKPYSPAAVRKKLEQLLCA
jgi:two-component system chemotaxis response regulator CheY